MSNGARGRSARSHSRRIDSDLEAAVMTAEGHVFYEQGDARAAEAGASRKVEAWTVPPIWRMPRWSR